MTNTIIKFKDLLFCILANLLFLLHTYHYDGYVHITFIHVVGGIIPLIISMKKHLRHLVKF
jgi:hypothetical protein